MVAKIASDFRKPYGLTVVKPEEVRDFLFPLEVRKIPRVGAKTDKVLLDMKIETIKDLAAMKPEVLIRLFGAWGARLHEFANGIDNREVIEEYETKSIGRDTTFEKDTGDEVQILRVLDELAEEVHTRFDYQRLQVQDNYSQDQIRAFRYTYQFQVPFIHHQ